MPFAYTHDFLLTDRPAERSQTTPTTPHTQPLPGITHMRFSLIRFRSPLLPESLLFSLPAGTEMFHFPAFPPHTLYIQVRVTAHDDCRVSPFGHPRIKARLTAPRGLSRPPTSFIGSWYQGIHRAPLKTWPQRCSRPLCSSQTTTSHPPPPGTTPQGSPGPATEETTTQHRSGRTFRHPTACPTPPNPHTHPPHPKRSGTSRYADHAVPNSQRSTHEQTTAGHSPTRWCCAP